MPSINLKDFVGNDILGEKAKAFLFAIEERSIESCEYVRNDYPKRLLFETALIFAGNDISDAIKADIEQHRRIGFYPAVEAQMELDNAVKHALIGSYKAAFGDLRRALELIVLSNYLSSEKTKRKDSIDWMNSNQNTPYTANMIGALVKDGRYKALNDSNQWAKNLKQCIGSLADISHNKGRMMGYMELNKINMHIGFTHLPNIDLKTLEMFCNVFIGVVGEIVVLLALYNPIVLVGLPIDEKFGFNPPMSGFYCDIQSERLTSLIPDRYLEFFKLLRDNDEQIESLTEWVEGFPDLTSEEMEQQIKDQDTFLNSFKKEKN